MFLILSTSVRATDNRSYEIAATRRSVLELFQQHVEITCRAAQLLSSGLKEGYSGVRHISKQVEALERNGDDLVHQLFRRLQSTFITPFDPEDIQAMATRLDDVLDAIEDAIFRVSCYGVNLIPQPAIQLGQMIDDSCQALSRAFRTLRDKKPVWNDCIEVNRLENEADAVERTVLAELFQNETSALSLLKQKEVIEILEHATDLCEDVADVIQNIAFKNT